MDESLARLPREPVDHFTKPFAQFLRIEAAAGAILLLCAIAALLLSNSPFSKPFLSFWDTQIIFRFGDIAISSSLKHVINDGLMTLFFFVGALELKREIILGELRDPRIAAFSLAGALGGMLVPASIFLLLEGSSPYARGWGTVMATDTALVIGCLSILGSHVPQSLKLFLLSLAIFDDIGAILVAAIGYGEAVNWLPLTFAMLGVAGVVGLTQLGVRSTFVYFVAGALLWTAIALSGLHPTLAGLVLGLMTPAYSWVNDDRLHAILGRVVAHPPGAHWSGDTQARKDLLRAGVATREALSPIVRHEIHLHPWLAFIVLPIFALANAGLPLSSTALDPFLTASVFICFVIGKPTGVLLFSYAAAKLRMALHPPELSWPLLCAGCLLTGIGFTMALFIADVAFQGDQLGAAKLGILAASVTSAVCGLSALIWLTSSETRAI